jgi:hypothetical protein
MKIQNDDIVIKSGPSLFYCLLGVGVLIFSSLAILGGSTWAEAWPLFTGAGVSIWLSRVGEYWLTSSRFIVRDIFWRKQNHDLRDLRWVQFGSGFSVIMWMGHGFIRVKNVPKLKKLKPLIEKIAEEKLSYYNYVFAERTALKRGQLSGCLDCHAMFLPTDLKIWSKLPQSFWWGRKKDQFLATCPDCKGWMIYTNPTQGQTVTKAGLQDMDAAFKLDKKTKMREIICEDVIQHTFMQHGK